MTREDIETAIDAASRTQIAKLCDVALSSFLSRGSGPEEEQDITAKLNAGLKLVIRVNALAKAVAMERRIT